MWQNKYSIKSIFFFSYLACTTYLSLPRVWWHKYEFVNREGSFNQLNCENCESATLDVVCNFRTLYPNNVNEWVNFEPKQSITRNICRNRNREEEEGSHWLPVIHFFSHLHQSVVSWAEEEVVVIILLTIGETIICNNWA